MMREPVPMKKYPAKQQASFAVSTATVAGLIDVLAHLGPTGLLVSGLAGYVAWKHGPELYEYVREQWRENFPSAASDPEEGEEEEQHEPGQPEADARSFWDKAFGLPPLGIPKRGDEGGPGEPGETDPDSASYEDDGLLYLGVSLRPHADTIFSNRLLILGMPGAGKSNLVAVLSEELGQFDAPILVFDKKPEYDPLCEERSS